MTEKIEYKNHTIEINTDDWAEDPRDWENLGTIITKKFWNETDINAYDREAVLDHIAQLEKENAVIMPVYVYSHGIDQFRARPWRNGELSQGHARFDSGLAGWIYATLDKVRECYGVKRVTKKVRERAEACLKTEIEIINDFSTGNVYGFEVVDSDGEMVDSCYGYFGLSGKQDAIDEAKSTIDHIMAKPHSHQPVMELLD